MAVVLAAEDDGVVGLVLGVEAEVVVGIGKVPIKAERDEAMRNLSLDNVAEVESFFGKQGGWVVEWEVGGDDDLAGVDVTLICFGREWLIIGYFDCGCVFVYLASEVGDGLGQLITELEWMKFGLIGESEISGGLKAEIGVGLRLELGRIVPLFECLVFVCEFGELIGLGGEPVAGTTGELAVELFVRDDGFYKVDGLAA